MQSNDIEELVKAAKGLGQHAILNTQVKHNMCKKSTKYMNVNTDLFRQKLLEKQLPLETRKRFSEKTNSCVYK